MIRIVAVAAIALGCTPAVANDFMAIHMQNQKVGSAVATYWHAQTAAAEPGGFMSIHMDNQQLGSSVVAFWNAYAAAGATTASVAITKSATHHAPEELEHTAKN